MQYNTNTVNKDRRMRCKTRRSKSVCISKSSVLDRRLISDSSYRGNDKIQHREGVLMHSAYIQETGANIRPRISHNTSRKLYAQSFSSEYLTTVLTHIVRREKRSNLALHRRTKLWQLRNTRQDLPPTSF